MPIGTGRVGGGMLGSVMVLAEWRSLRTLLRWVLSYYDARWCLLVVATPVWYASRRCLGPFFNEIHTKARLPVSAKAPSAAGKTAVLLW